MLPRIAPDRAIGWGLAAASLASLGVVACPRPPESAPLALMRGGGDRAAPPAWSSRGASTSAPRSPRSRTAASCSRPTTWPATWAASRCRCWSSGCSRTLIGLTAALACLSAAAAPRCGVDLGGRPALAFGTRGTGAGLGPRSPIRPPSRLDGADGPPGVRSRGPRRHVARGRASRRPHRPAPRRPGEPRPHPRSRRVGRSGRASRRSSPSRPASGSTSTPPPSTIAARRPGPAHDALARLERAGVISALITQSVDRLHTRAGSLDPVEVYGTVLVMRCERCGERYGLPEVGALLDRVRRRGAALHHRRLRLPAPARGDPVGRGPAAPGRRAGLGARGGGRRLLRARLGPAHGADLAAALGAAHPRGATGAGRRDPDPVRPLRPHGRSAPRAPRSSPRWRT